MPIDLSLIKQLSTEEKLLLIDELWDSINEKDIPNELPETLSLLEERMEKYKAGKMETYSQEESMVLLKKNLEEYRKNAGL
jgi:putative addiction module component (TIGR02574 family)